MTISDDARVRPIPALQKLPIVDPRTGLPTPYFAQMLSAWRDYTLGAARVIPCNAEGTDVISLTPTHPVSPLIDGYRDYDRFTFVAANTSTAAVTATVVPRSGTLATLKVYKTAGAAQAGSGDVVAGSLYDAIFNDALDGGAGGFVLK